MCIFSECCSPLQTKLALVGKRDLGKKRNLHPVGEFICEMFAKWELDSCAPRANTRNNFYLWSYPQGVKTLQSRLAWKTRERRKLFFKIWEIPSELRGSRTRSTGITNRIWLAGASFERFLSAKLVWNIKWFMFIPLAGDVVIVFEPGLPLSESGFSFFSPGTQSWREKKVCDSTKVRHVLVSAGGWIGSLRGTMSCVGEFVCKSLLSI